MSKPDITLRKEQKYFIDVSTLKAKKKIKNKPKIEIYYKREIIESIVNK